MGIKLTIKLDDGTFSFDLEEELRIRDTKLNRELGRQPSKFARFAQLAVLARGKAEALEQEVNQYEYDLDLKVRANDKKGELTENRIKALVKTDKKRRKMVMRLVRAREQAEMASAAREAFAQREHCLIAMGANRRAERNAGELSIRKGK